MAQLTKRQVSNISRKIFQCFEDYKKGYTPEQIERNKMINKSKRVSDGHPLYANVQFVIQNIKL